jgi:Fic family protein
MSPDVTHPYALRDLPPGINLKDPVFYPLLLKARVQLAQLKGQSINHPNPMLLLSPTVLREAVASSSIENINTTVSDVLQHQLFPESEQRSSNKEVLRYRDAVMWGFEHLRTMPVSSRLIIGVHKHLIPDSAEGYRKQQNKIEVDTTHEVVYTPPASPEVPRLIGNWEKFVNQTNDGIDPLIKCAVAHYQFEAIHPFGDGNGRVGRILMVLQLIKDEIVDYPLLFVSGYINNHRADYYRLLKGVTVKNDWTAFIQFMLEAFYHQAQDGNIVLSKINDLYIELKRRLKTDHTKIYTADLAQALFAYPVIHPARLKKELKVHYITAGKYLSQLAAAGVLRHEKHGKYNLYTNQALIDVLSRK